MQRCSRRMTRSHGIFLLTCGFLFELKVVSAPRLAFLVAPRAIRATTGPEPRVGSHHVFARRSIISSSAARDATRTYTASQPVFHSSSRGDPRKQI